MRILYQAPVAYGWIRQRPQFVADGLAEAGHQVLWFFAARPGRCRFRRLHLRSGLTVLELPVLPLASRCRPLAWLNRLWVSWWLRGVEADVSIATHPASLSWLPQRLRNCVAYDCMDVQTAFFRGRQRRQMRMAERMLVSTAQWVFASSPAIRDNLMRDYGIGADRISLVPNGVVFDVPAVGDTAVRVRRPSIAYFGTISRWFDWDSVRNAAERHPEWTFDLFGPVEDDVAGLPPNIVLHGSITHNKVLGQARAADVLILPFLRNDLIDGVDPVKMYEYLRAGRPVVSSWWPLMEKFRAFPAVGFYGGNVGFETCVRRALEGPGSFSVPETFLRENEWSVRVKAIESVLVALRGSRG